MKREYRSWYSDRLQREMHIRVYGHTGTPLLILPTQIRCATTSRTSA